MTLVLTTFLLICAVSAQMFGGGSNLALLKPASMSVTDELNTGAELAVDGHTVTNFCTYLNSGWWQVELLMTAWVNRVDITSRNGAYGLPKDFTIEVLSDPRCGSTPKLCHQHSGALTVNTTTSIICDSPVKGRSVRITQTDPLFLCEVAVYDVNEPGGAGNDAKREIQFVQTAGWRKLFTQHVQVEVTSVLECGRACVKLDTCPYFNYREDGSVNYCELSSPVNTSDVLIGDTDWNFYELNPCVASQAN